MKYNDHIMNNIIIFIILLLEHNFRQKNIKRIIIVDIKNN